MREAIEQILDGTYDYEKGALDFSCAKLEIGLQKGEIYEGSFKIFASEGKYTMGYVSVSDPRMECLTPTFTGNEEEISFRFHGEWMEAGEVTKGEFVVVSNKGEYYLPYVVTVEHTVPQSSIGPIKNLFHFTNLAKSNWKEAVRLFYSPVFAYVIQNSDKQVHLIYQGLSAYEGNEQNVEEFLIAMNKKQKVEFLVTEESLTFENISGVVESNLNIFRNGWGYTSLEVSVEGDFLLVEKNRITDDDFLGNRFTLPVYMDSELLHAGKNLGAVCLKNAYGTLRIPVEITQKYRDSLAYSCHVEREKNIFRLMELYQDFRLKKVSTAAWIKETTRLLERMLTLDERDASTRLFQAHLLITKEHFNEAGWILEHVGELTEEESPVLEAYYLYLNTLLKKDESYTKEMAWQVSKIYRECGEDWRVAWLLLFLSEEYSRNAASKWFFLAEQFENGCRSPLIYVEALLLMNANPTLLRKLGDFELQVINYGRKESMLSSEVLEQVIYLSERVKEYEPLLFRVLEGCYRQKKDTRVLKEICTLLIKGNKTDKKYFEWFEKGVEEELRITNLYEYYMLSMNLDKEPKLPKRVLLYFTYQTHLDYLHSAYLFYDVVRREQEFPDILESYRPRIELFVKEQVTKRHVNRHLAYLYQHFLTEDMIDEKLAGPLSVILFSHEIRLKQEGIRSVVVCQPSNEQELQYQVMGDRVWVPLYGSESCVLFEGQWGNRFVKDVPHSMEKLMSPDRLLNKVAALVSENPALDIYRQEHMAEGIEPGPQELELWLRMQEYPFVPDEVKAQIIPRILQYYYHMDDKKHLIEFINGLSGERLSAFQRGEVIRYMVLCEQYEAGYEWLSLYGDCAVDEKLLLRLLENMVERKGFAQETLLVGLCYQMFMKGRYSSTTLQYLMLYYQGMSRDLKKLWKASRSYSMDRTAFCERMLIQMLFSGSFVGEQAEIFKEYVQGNAEPQVEEAYLAKNCYDYFVNDKLIQRQMLLEIGRLYREKQQVLKVCKLAYLKYYADNKAEISKEDAPVISAFLDSLLQEGIRLNSFLELKQYSNRALRLVDKTIVEYHASPESVPRIHYLIMQENGEAGEYITEPMELALGGIYFKEFVLFFGESLQYYIVEERDGEEKLTQSGTWQRREVNSDELNGRYGAINDIAMSLTLQDYATFDALLEEYYRKDFYNQELFELRH